MFFLFSFLTDSVYLKTIKSCLSSVRHEDLGSGIFTKYLHSVPINILILMFYITVSFFKVLPGDVL